MPRILFTCFPYHFVLNAYTSTVSSFKPMISKQILKFSHRYLWRVILLGCHVGFEGKYLPAFLWAYCIHLRSLGIHEEECLTLMMEAEHSSKMSNPFTISPGEPSQKTWNLTDGEISLHSINICYHNNTSGNLTCSPRSWWRLMYSWIWRPFDFLIFWNPRNVVFQETWIFGKEF